MTTWFVTRHSGAVEWAQMQGITARQVSHLDPDEVHKDDTVMGTLPIPIIAQLTQKGVRYFHLILDLPPDLRGQELSANDMIRLGAELQEFTAKRV